MNIIKKIKKNIYIRMEKLIDISLNKIEKIDTEVL